MLESVTQRPAKKAFDAERAQTVIAIVAVLSSTLGLVLGLAGWALR